MNIKLILIIVLIVNIPLLVISWGLIAKLTRKLDEALDLLRENN